MQIMGALIMEPFLKIQIRRICSRIRVKLEIESLSASLIEIK